MYLQPFFISLLVAALASGMGLNAGAILNPGEEIMKIIFEEKMRDFETAPYMESYIFPQQLTPTHFRFLSFFLFSLTWIQKEPEGRDLMRQSCFLLFIPSVSNYFLFLFFLSNFLSFSHFFFSVRIFFFFR